MADNYGKLHRTVSVIVAILWILASGFKSCQCFEMPRFQSVPTTVKTFENNTVTLPCLYQGTHVGLRWYFGDYLIKDTRRPGRPANDRVQVLENGSLQVVNVHSEDTGDYLCEVVFSDTPPIRQEHSIEVQFPPKASVFPTGNIRLRIGSSFEITCDASGVPDPIISWRKLNSHGVMEWISENKRHLHVEVRDRESAGVYQCVANNGVEEPSTANVNLHVNYIPEVRSEVKSVHTKIGYRATLECIVVASPSGKIEWFHHGLPLQMDHHVSRSDVDMSNEPYSGTESRHRLTIRSVRERDMGMYECRAENEMGSKGVLINLSGIPKQSIFKTSPIRSMGRTFNLLWQTESYSPISEYRLKFRPHPFERTHRGGRGGQGDWREVTIPAEFSEAPIHTAAYSLPGLKVGAVYEVAVLSRNRYGWGEQSKIYRFATGGEVESPSKVTEETQEEDLGLYGGELEDNSIDELPGVYDYSFSGAKRRWQKEGVKIMVLLGVVTVWLQSCGILC